MDVSEIKRRVDLLKKVSQQKTVLIKDVAKELKARQTDLMIFIEDNPKLFHTDQVWSYKKESYIEYTRFGKSRQTRTVQDKCKGLGITEVYLRPEDNYRTDEHVALMQRKYAKTIWVRGWDNYGTIEGHYVAEDKADTKDEHRYHLWRNTAAKIRELTRLGILHEETFYIGGAFDCSSHKISTAITAADAERARAGGWTVIGL